MLTENGAHEFADHWVKAWNSHDLDEIMSHYSADVLLVSPVSAKIRNDPFGMVRGKEALRAYFMRGLEAYPNLKFELVDVMWGLSSIEETDSVRGTRFEVPLAIRFLRPGGFDAQSLVTVPTVKLARRLGRLNKQQLVAVEARVSAWLGRAIRKQGLTTACSRRPSAAIDVAR